MAQAAAPVAEPPPVVPATDSDAVAERAGRRRARGGRLAADRRALGDARLLGVGDGGRADARSQRLFQAGEEQTFDVQKELVLTAGDAAAISLKLNGADARPLGKTGEVVTTRLTLDNFKDFLITR